MARVRTSLKSSKSPKKRAKRTATRNFPTKKKAAQKRNYKSSKTATNNQSFNWLRWLLRNFFSTIVALFCIISIILLISYYVGGYTKRASVNLNGLGLFIANISGLKYEKLAVYGRDNITSQEIIDAINSPLGHSILLFDINKAATNITKLPLVKHAAITRLLPNTIAVSIIERVPVAIWANNNKVYLIDDEGVLLKPIKDDQYTELPYFNGTNPPDNFDQIYSSIASSRYLKRYTYSISVVGNDNWQIHLQKENKKTLIFKMPREESRQNMIYVDKLLKDGIVDKNVSLVDLRHKKKISIF